MTLDDAGIIIHVEIKSKTFTGSYETTLESFANNHDPKTVRKLKEKGSAKWERNRMGTKYKFKGTII